MATKCSCPDRNVSENCPGVGVGVLTLYAACYSDITGVTVDTADQYITAIGFTKASGFTSGTFVQLGVPFESTNFDIELVKSKQNNNYFFNPKITFKLGSLDPDIIKIYETFAKSKLVLMVKLHQSRYYLLGYENGIVAETGNLTTGTASSDFKGLTMTLSSFGETKSTRELAPALVANIATLLATV